MLALFASGCVSLPPPSGLEAPRSVSTGGQGEAPARVLIPSPGPSLTPGPSGRGEPPRGSRAVVRFAGASSTAQPGATLIRQAVLAALEDASTSLHHTTNLLARIESKPEGLTERANGVFTSFVEYSDEQRRWIILALGGAHRRVQWASEVDDPDMQVALLRLAGPRLEAALCGAQLLPPSGSTSSTSRTSCSATVPTTASRGCSGRWPACTGTMEPAMTALSSLEPRAGWRPRRGRCPG